MTHTTKEASDRCELAAVIIDNPNCLNECILYPSNATDNELETMWILAKGSDYSPLADIR